MDSVDYGNNVNFKRDNVIKQSEILILLNEIVCKMLINNNNILFFIIIIIKC